MYNVYRIELKMHDRLVGSLPLNTEALEGYIKAKFPEGEDDTEDVIAEGLELDEEKERSMTGFKKDEVGIYVGGYQIKAMLAESASLQEITIKKRGSKNTLREGLVVLGLDAEDNYTGNKIYVLPYRSEADGISSRTGHVSGPSGSRSIVSVSEYVQDATLKFEIRLLSNRMIEKKDGKKFSPHDLKLCLAHARHLGIGGERKYQTGTFEVVKFEACEPLSVEDTIDF